MFSLPHTGRPFRRPISSFTPALHGFPSPSDQNPTHHHDSRGPSPPGPLSCSPQGTLTYRPSARRAHAYLGDFYTRTLFPRYLNDSLFHLTRASAQLSFPLRERPDLPLLSQIACQPLLFPLSLFLLQRSQLLNFCESVVCLSLLESKLHFSRLHSSVTTVRTNVWKERLILDHCLLSFRLIF